MLLDFFLSSLLNNSSLWWVTQCVVSVRKAGWNFVFDEPKVGFGTTLRHPAPGVTDQARCKGNHHVQLHQNKQSTRSKQVPNVTKRSEENTKINAALRTVENKPRIQHHSLCVCVRQNYSLSRHQTVQRYPKGKRTTKTCLRAKLALE